MNTVTKLALLGSISYACFFSCGKDGGSNGPDKPTTDGAGTPDKTSKPVGDLPPSMYVTDESSLVACDDSRRGYLAYVQNTSEFKACLASGWTTVNVRGKDGANGKDGSPAAATSPNLWYDHISKKYWFLAGTGFSWSQSYCGDNYRIPTEAEATDAIAHGIKPGYQALGVTPPVGMYIYKNGGETGWYINTTTLAVTSTSSGTHVCIQK